MLSRESSLALVRESIRAACRRAGRSPTSVRLIAVSKGQTPESIQSLFRQGQEEFGENYVQEWKSKKLRLQELGVPKLTWHFIGHLQSNKLREVVGAAECIHSVDSLPLALKMNRVAGEKGIRQTALLEVQLETEESKTGWSPENLRKSLPALSALTHVDFRGLMVLPPPTERPEDSRSFFTRLKSLLDEINQMGVFSRPLTELSMGMSQDFEVAVEEGATLVRIGTAIFGPRK